MTAFLSVLTVLAGITVETAVPVESLTLSQEIALDGSGVIVRLDAGLPGDTGGLPDLPVVPWTVDLPEGTTATAVQVTGSGWEVVLDDVFVPPLPDPAPLRSIAAPSYAEPDMDVYGTDSAWPLSPVRLTGTGFRNGLPVAELLVVPYRYNPVSGRLERLTSLELSLETGTAVSAPRTTGDDGAGRMVIFTDESLVPVFSELAGRRTDEGIITEVVTMDTVYSVSSGRDDAEMLRNYIIDYEATYGLDYVLLGGDTDLVPFRFAYAMTCEAGMHPREDSLPCDLYYSDLDGSWDENGNDIFGEIEDNIDLYADVFVGRVTVENTAEAQAWLDKQTAYEDCIEDDHLQKALFLAMILWWDPYTDSALSKNLIDELYIPWYIDITKLYESLGNENLATVMIALNEGQNLVNHDGHAWYSGLSVGEDFLTADHLDAINSSGRYSAVLYSIGCWSAAFDFDAVAEHFLTSELGCGVGYIGNSSYGWGSPGNPTHGYSDVLDRLYFAELYDDHGTRAGELLAVTKEYYIPYSQWENVYRWHEFDVNLLGDPSFRPYRLNPAVPVVTCPPFVSPGTELFPVTVSGCSVNGLLVCVHDEGSEYHTAELDGTGQVVFDFTSPPQGDVTVTVSGAGIRRTSFTVSQQTGPDPVVSDVQINDSGGDGMLSPGDQAYIELTLMNQGTETLSGITLEAVIASGPASLSSYQMTFPDLQPGSWASGSTPLDISVMPTASSGDVVDMDLGIEAAQGTWDLDLPVMVCAPGLYFATYSVDDGGDGIPDPGETFTLTLNIANLGLMDADTVSLVMTDYPAWVSWVEDSAWVASIPMGSTAPFDLTCQLSSSAPTPSFPWLFFDMESVTASYQTSDTLRLTVGETGLNNDVENGEAGWTHQGTGDLWHITSAVSHSPSHSWFCGDSGGYQPGMDCGLLSPPMILAPDASLSFWTTFDTAIYGTDGMYPLVHDLISMETDTLDFIGSGGALPYGDGWKGIGTGWVTYSYDLSWIESGREIQIEFRFISDGDPQVGGGFYVDDIVVEGGYLGSMGSQGPQTEYMPLGLPRPNPASNAFAIPILLEDHGEWHLGIYDLSGRLVHRIEGTSPVAEILEVDITGLASGIYFLRLTGTGDMTRRLAVVR
jgi:hypothetical protein